MYLTLGDVSNNMQRINLHSLTFGLGEKCEAEVTPTFEGALVYAHKLLRRFPITSHVTHVTPLDSSSFHSMLAASVEVPSYNALVQIPLADSTSISHGPCWNMHNYKVAGLVVVHINSVLLYFTSIRSIP